MLETGIMGRMNIVTSIRQWTRTEPKENFGTSIWQLAPGSDSFQKSSTGKHWKMVKKVRTMNHRVAATRRARIGILMFVYWNIRQ